MVARGLSMPYRWDDDYGARVGIMPRDGGDADVKWFDVEPCYVFHPMNAYDEDDTVVVDVCRHPTMFAKSIEGPNDGGTPTLDRWTVDPAAGKVREERLDDRGQRVPAGERVAADVEAPLRLRGRHHARARHAVRHRRAPQARPALAAPPTEHHFANGGQPGEFVFVPSREATSEDDGYLMGYVYDPTA